MRRTIRSSEVVFDLSPFRDLDADELDAVHEAADRYGEFLDLQPRVNVTSSADA